MPKRDPLWSRWFATTFTQPGRRPAVGPPLPILVHCSRDRYRPVPASFSAPCLYRRVLRASVPGASSATLPVPRETQLYRQLLTGTGLRAKVRSTRENGTTRYRAAPRSTVQSEGSRHRRGQYRSLRQLAIWGSYPYGAVMYGTGLYRQSPHRPPAVLRGTEPPTTRRIPLSGTQLTDFNRIDIIIMGRHSPAHGNTGSEGHKQHT
jgi:hypothetical protein